MHVRRPPCACAGRTTERDGASWRADGLHRMVVAVVRGTHVRIVEVADAVLRGCHRGGERVLEAKRRSRCVRVCARRVVPDARQCENPGGNEFALQTPRSWARLRASATKWCTPGVVVARHRAESTTSPSSHRTLSRSLDTRRPSSVAQSTCASNPAMASPRPPPAPRPHPPHAQPRAIRICPHRLR